MMKYELERYDDYKNSGIEWLGNVPNHWQIKRLKDISKLIIDGTHFTPDYTDYGVHFLSVNDITRTPFDLQKSKFISYDAHRELAKRCNPKKGDILLSKNGTIGVPFVICFSEEVSIYVSLCLIKLDAKTYNRYCYYSFLSSFMFEQYNLHSKMTSVTNLHLDKLKNFLKLLPPFSEQQAIADYLDTKIAQIDRKIELLTRKETKYNELKKSIINETVTRGLDKTVMMKASGFEWIGEVPEHWVSKRFCEVFILGNKLVSTVQMKERNVFHYSIPVVQQTGTGQLEDGSDIDSNKALITGNELLFSKLNPRKETVCITTENSDILTVASSEFLVLKPIRYEMFLKFGFYIFITSYNKEKICSTVKSVTKSHQRANPTDIFKMSQYIPPYEEQKEIADYLDIKTAHIDRIISTINTQIDKLKELRKTLINDVVTGKIKVYKEGEAV